MAKKVTTITEQLPDENEQLTAEALSEDEINLQAIRERYAPVGATYKIYKMVKGANPAWCFDSIDEIDEATIQQQYGGGRYAIRIFMDKRLRDTVYIDIAEPAIVIGGANKGAANDPMTVMVTMMQSQLQQQQALLMALIGRPAPTPTPSTVQDTVALFTLLKNNEPLSGNSLVTKIVEKAIDKLGEPSEGGDWKMELIKSVKDVAPTAITALASMSGIKPSTPMMQPGMVIPGPLPSLPVPQEMTVPQETQPSQEITPESLAMLEDIAMRQGIAIVKPKILGGVLPPDLAIEWLLANAGDATYQPFLKACLTKSIDDVIKLDPEIANPPFKQWFTEVLDGIKEEFKRDAESQDPKK